MGTFFKLKSIQEVQGHSRAVRKFKMFVNQIHQKSEKAKEKIDMENSVSKARKSAGELGLFHLVSKNPKKPPKNRKPKNPSFYPDLSKILLTWPKSGSSKQVSGLFDVRIRSRWDVQPKTYLLANTFQWYLTWIRPNLTPFDPSWPHLNSFEHICRRKIGIKYWWGTYKCCQYAFILHLFCWSCLDLLRGFTWFSFLLTDSNSRRLVIHYESYFI